MTIKGVKNFALEKKLAGMPSRIITKDTNLEDLMVKKSGDTMTDYLRFIADKGIITGAGTLNIQRSGTIRLILGAAPGTTYCAINTGSVFYPVQAPTATAPAYVKGGIYFDTTLNKLMVGGATAWETVTSA